MVQVPYDRSKEIILALKLLRLGPRGGFPTLDSSHKSSNGVEDGIVVGELCCSTSFVIFDGIVELLSPPIWILVPSRNGEGMLASALCSWPGCMLSPSSCAFGSRTGCSILASLPSSVAGRCYACRRGRSRRVSWPHSFVA